MFLSVVLVPEHSPSISQLCVSLIYMFLRETHPLGEKRMQSQIETTLSVQTLVIAPQIRERSVLIADCVA